MYNDIKQPRFYVNVMEYLLAKKQRLHQRNTPHEQLCGLFKTLPISIRNYMVKEGDTFSSNDMWVEWPEGLMGKGDKCFWAILGHLLHYRNADDPNPYSFFSTEGSYGDVSSTYIELQDLVNCREYGHA